MTDARQRLRGFGDKELDWIGRPRTSRSWSNAASIGVLRPAIRRHTGRMALPLADAARQGRSLERRPSTTAWGCGSWCRWTPGPLLQRRRQAGRSSRRHRRLTPTSGAPYGQSRRQAGHGGHLRPSGQRSPPREVLHDEQAVHLPCGHVERREGAVTVKADYPLGLCYGVAFWDGEVEKATVGKLYRQWLALSGAESRK